MSDTTKTLTAIAFGEAPVLETLAEMTMNTFERSGLDEKTYLMVRIAGLVAMDAPPVSYAISLDASVDALEVEELQGILVALAPIVGSARIASAASNILDVFMLESEIGAEEEDEDLDDAQAVAHTHDRARARHAEQTEDQDFELETV